MEKIIIIIILLLAVNTNAQTTVSLNADIRGRSCAGGLGICTITGGGVIGESKSYGELIDKHSFLLVVKRNKITKQEEMSLAGAKISDLSKAVPQTFKMEAELKLDDETANKLGLESNYNIIPEGDYPMSFDDEKVYIKINVVRGK